MKNNQLLYLLVVTFTLPFSNGQWNFQTLLSSPEGVFDSIVHRVESNGPDNLPVILAWSEGVHKMIRCTDSSCSNPVTTTIGTTTIPQTDPQKYASVQMPSGNALFFYSGDGFMKFYCMSDDCSLYNDTTAMDVPGMSFSVITAGVGSDGLAWLAGEERFMHCLDEACDSYETTAFTTTPALEGEEIRYPVGKTGSDGFAIIAAMKPVEPLCLPTQMIALHCNDYLCSNPNVTILEPDVGGTCRQTFLFAISIDIGSDGFPRIGYVQFNSATSPDGVYYRTTCYDIACSTSCRGPVPQPFSSRITKVNTISGFGYTLMQSWEQSIYIQKCMTDECHTLGDDLGTVSVPGFSPHSFGTQIGATTVKLNANGLGVGLTWTGGNGNTVSLFYADITSNIARGSTGPGPTDCPQVTAGAGQSLLNLSFQIIFLAIFYQI